MVYAAYFPEKVAFFYKKFFVFCSEAINVVLANYIKETGR